MRHANGDAHIHSDGDSDGNCHIHSDGHSNSYAYTDSYSYGHSNSNSYAYTDSYCYGHGYSNCDCEHIAAAYTDATAPADTAAACEQLLFQ